MEIKLREGYLLTELECIAKGGHKYEEYRSVVSAKYMHRRCIYCGHEQVGHVPEVVWEDLKFASS